MILNLHEKNTLYGIPILNDIERTEYFSFNAVELKRLNSFKERDDAIYFAISLAFFKLRYTFIDFSYRDVTKERQHVMRRYFPNKPSPKSLPSDKDTITNIRNKVLTLVGFERFKGKAKEAVLKKITSQIALHPRQRQLCRAFLKLLIKENIAIPGLSSLTETTSKLWNAELTRLTNNYKRYSTKQERESIKHLLSKTDDMHRIISIRKDMKDFATQEINAEVEKHSELRIVFLIAKKVLPKLKLPKLTIQYYSELINYYNGSRLNELKPEIAQLYLLCYGFSRFQIINDNLLEALKKRTFNFSDSFTKSAEHEAAKFMGKIASIRKQVYDLLMVIKHDTNKDFISKPKIYSCIPYSDLDTVADIILNDNLDLEQLYWKYVEENHGSIQTNLRQIFLSLDITILRDESFKKVVEFMKKYLARSKSLKFPNYVKDWIPSNLITHIVTSEDQIIAKRFEFLFYKKLAHHISTRKLILEYSVKHKDMEENLIKLPKWNKEKSKLLKSLPYSKIKIRPNELLKKLEQSLPELYKKVNHAIESGENSDVIIKTNRSGENTWRLKPLGKAADPNERLFKHFQKRSIVDVMNFVNAKTNYINAFESILPKYGKLQENGILINAVVLANALRIGSHGMADICDLPQSSLLTTEKSYIRMETLNVALHKVNLELSKLEIFKDYNIQGSAHASLDGLKIGSRRANISARFSPKFLGKDAGVSSYNLIFNYLSITGKLISSNQYEGNYTFEMMLHQNMNDFDIEYASTDKHGINSLNFALFDLTDYVFAPRIPKPHNQTLWSFGQHHHYRDMLIKPHKMANKNHIINNWDSMQRTLVSMINGEAAPSVIIGQMSSQNYRSPTKLGFSHYNNLVRSEFILNYVDNKIFQRSIECALNRGEAYNNLYRAITVLNGGKFRGQSEVEMMVWNQCTKLIAAIILYYNTYILNYLYLNAKTLEEKEWLLNLSPGAWVHINLLGYYQFYGAEGAKFIEAIEAILAQWNWQETVENG